ncbi:MAG: fused MFS/spermidine synthase [Labilithrix sp.]|nr:fused MFS/spermidine synthase [Labilithrix sp.]
MTFRLPRVSALLFFSGACALVYQVAWFRELRLIFGASTAASAAVLTVFMGGLGAGGAILGKRADSAKNPLALYANLELFVALMAGVSPLLVWIAQAIYLGVGGSSTLGSTGATLVRLVLSVLVLGPATVAMGGTLPAAAKAVERSSAGRQRVAVLYGVNTMGAVLGTVTANFLFIEIFGTRLTLWLACLVNVLVALLGRSLARGAPEERSKAATSDEPIDNDEPTASQAAPRWFPPLAAAVAGLSFMLMELVWYRMLAPLLGGSSYTFGLILAVALVGIGIGGGIYSLTKRPATLSLFAITCTLEALAIGIPYALGDRLAIFAQLLRPLAQVSFSGSIISWTLISSIVVLPTAIVSGYQFPAIIGLYGRGAKGVGRDVGRAYLANTLGSMVGSIGGGFGLLPLLSAPRCWQAVALLLVGTAALAVALDLRARTLSLRPFAAACMSGALALFVTVAPDGPGHAWRHSGIGAGRSDNDRVVGPETAERFVKRWRAAIQWDEDGLESTVALGKENGFVFIVNGKADGHAIGDGRTQIMSGLLAALLHENPTSALVVGLGTGSTAGWLGAVPSIEVVDVVELEPSILRVARDCVAVNKAALDNPKVHVQLGDAREALRTTSKRYDIIFSEPSNPYRAGISSLFTVEYYRSAAERLNPNGLFVQWLQTYEVDAFALATAAITLREVFPNVSFWETMSGDLLMIGQQADMPIDVDRIRARITQEPFASAVREVWKTTSAEGVLAHFVAQPRFAEVLRDEQLGVRNYDDQNFLEFAFARNVGQHVRMDQETRQLIARLRLDTPHTKGAYDPSLVLEEKMLSQLLDKTMIDPHLEKPPPHVVGFGRVLTRLQQERFSDAIALWSTLDRQPRSYHETLLLAEATARTGSDQFLTLLPAVDNAAERELLHGIWLTRTEKVADAVERLERGFTLLRRDPWVRMSVAGRALALSVQIGQRDPSISRRFALALAEPFAAEAFRMMRIHAELTHARASRDPEVCLAALARLEPLLFTQPFYETRVVCYRQANHPETAKAEAELERLLAFSSRFGAAIASPAAPVLDKSSPPTHVDGLDASAIVDDASSGVDARADAPNDTDGTPAAKSPLEAGARTAAPPPAAGQDSTEAGAP